MSATSSSKILLRQTTTNTIFTDYYESIAGSGTPTNKYLTDNVCSFAYHNLSEMTIFPCIEQIKKIYSVKDKKYEYTFTLRK